MLPLARTPEFPGCKPSSGGVLGPTVTSSSSGGTLRPCLSRNEGATRDVVARPIPRFNRRGRAEAPVHLTRFSLGKRWRAYEREH
jgi:hypothetical protein